MFVINDTGSPLSYSVVESSDGLTITSANLEHGATTSINLSTAADVGALGMQATSLTSNGVKFTSPSSMTILSSFTSDNTCLWEYRLESTSGSWHKVPKSNRCSVSSTCVETSTVNSQYITGHDGQFLYVACVPDIFPVDEECN